KPVAEHFRLTVNGNESELEASPDTPLLYALRNDLGLKGTRFGCGNGQCGACFVLIDGHPAPACDTPLWSAAGKIINPVEGLRKTRDFRSGCMSTATARFRSTAVKSKSARVS